jgi:hypothetical protein
VSDEIGLQFTRVSAFYSPLIAGSAGGFLKDEGLAPRLSVAPPGPLAVEGIAAGRVHVCRSAPSQGFGPPRERGQVPRAVRFALINEMDEAAPRRRRGRPAARWPMTGA